MSDYKSDFFAKYASAAIEEQKRYGIPASVTLAQMAVESGFGRAVWPERITTISASRSAVAGLKQESRGVITVMTGRMTASAGLRVRWTVWNTIPKS